MPTVRDSALASVFTGLSKKLDDNPRFVAKDTDIVDILAAVGDRFWKGAAKLRVELLAAGGKEAQLAIAKKGMSATEKQDLEALLDGGALPLSPTDKNFLDALVGRAPKLEQGDLKITKVSSRGFEGVATPGATISVINVSKAAGGRFHLEDVVEIGKAGADGKFNGGFDDRVAKTDEGDDYVVEARAKDGKVTILDLRIRGVAAKDSANAVLAKQRLELVYDDDAGKWSLTNNNASRPLSERGAQLRFVNTRTGDTKTVTLDEKGQLPKGFTLTGKKDDGFSVAISDGVNNADFAAIECTLPQKGSGTGAVGGLEDPTPTKDDHNANGASKYKLMHYRGPLVHDHIAPSDVLQGNIGNCYVPGAVAGLAAVAAKELEGMMSESVEKDAQGSVVKDADGEPRKLYSFSFKYRDYLGWKTDEVKVDGDLYVRDWGGPLYGTDDGSTDPKRMEMWWPLFEKAYAIFVSRRRGAGASPSYETIGKGGAACDVLEAILGRKGYTSFIGPNTQVSTWRAIERAMADARPVALGTHDKADRYTGTGIYANHAYSVLGCRVRDDGAKVIKLRNPWGESEPTGNGKNDGVFELTIDELCKHFQTLYSVE